MEPSTIRWLKTALIASIVFLLVALAQLVGTRARPARAFPAGNTYVVNSTADLPDADQGDGMCFASNGLCTLRAAIMQANFVTGLDTITVPSGIYVLTRPGDDDQAVLDDLDITDDLTIQGAGSGVTIVDGNGAVTGDRVFQILSSAKETSLSDLTVRNGKQISLTFDSGGGLNWEGDGGHLRLSDVIFEGNASRYGGGLSVRYSSAGGSVELDNITLHANSATAGGGGLVGDFSAAFSDFVMRNSLVYSNTAYEGGGMQFGGTPSFGQMRIEDSEFYSNTASLSAAIDNFSGNAAHPLIVRNSHLHDNGASFYGGGIGNHGTLVITTTTLDANTASMQGGGLYNYEGGQVNLAQSTLSNNFAQYGGGIYSEFFINNSARLTMTNSTLSGNSVNHDGGGIYAASGHVLLLNATVAANYVLLPLPSPYPGMGGGLYVSTTAVIELQNTLLGDNFRRTGALQIDQDDCAGVITSIWYNLIESKNNCTVAGSEFGNHDGLDPVLGPLQMNGGRTATKALLPGSPAIDVGQSPACTDATGAPLLTDQRGFIRPANGGVNGLRCDIGAYEYYPYQLNLPIIRR